MYAREFIRRHPLTLYFVLAYAIGWLAFVPLALSRTGIGILPVSLPMEFTFLGTLGPTVAALVSHRVQTGNFRAFRLWPGTWPVLRGTMAGVLLIVLVYVAIPASVLAKGGPTGVHWGALASLSFYNYSTLLGGPLLEEPGWRGYALPRLQSRFGPVKATLLVGAFWWGWHLPLFLIFGLAVYLLPDCHRAERRDDLRSQPVQFQCGYGHSDARCIQLFFESAGWAACRITNSEWR